MENKEIEKNQETQKNQETKIQQVKVKNPNRIAGGKKSAETKRKKAELRKKEIEELEKENTNLKNSITSDTSDNTGITKDNKVETTFKQINGYKNYLPLCVIGIIALGMYTYYKPNNKQKPFIQKKEEINEIDPFEFN